MKTFDTKEFAKIWKKISNDKRIRPTLVQHGSGKYSYQTKEKGWIYPEHHIIYNIMRELPIDRGFDVGTEGFEEALSFLKNTSNFGFAGRVYKPFEEFIEPEKFKEILSEIKLILNTPV